MNWRRRIKIMSEGIVGEEPEEWAIRREIAKKESQNTLESLSEILAKQD